MHMVIHDMNNPLNAVLGYADLLAAGYGGALPKPASTIYVAELFHN